MAAFSLEGTIVLPAEGKIIRGEIQVCNGIIESVVEKPVSSRRLILPGLIDAHVHIESSMLTPSEFARAAVVHGTTATVSDPHEIANVLGIEGVEFMIANGNQTPFRFFFGAPSCVPATPLETSGAVIDDRGVLDLLMNPAVKYLAEMMNFPGVIYHDQQVMAKLSHAKSLGKPVDGHAPGLTGEPLDAYVGAGISTDHECFSLDEAREKASKGMKILIREGSAAKNFETLLPLLKEFPNQVMFCSDDKHPDDLQNGHMNLLIQRGLALGYPLIDLVRACTLNPVRHYNLECGLLQIGDPADFIVIDDPETFSISQTWISGEKVAENGKSFLPCVMFETPNRFADVAINLPDIRVNSDCGRVKVIGALDGQLVTNQLLMDLPVLDGVISADPDQDVLKIVVLNRYVKAPPAVGFIHGFGLKKGALASTVAHDSHNLIAVGVDDHTIIHAMNTLIAHKGGLCAATDDKVQVLALPVAGIMSDQDLGTVAGEYHALENIAREFGTTLTAPFMTLSFMALLVIPELKLGDKGLFDGNTFAFTSLFA
jgi:adenine deaminase